MRQQVLAHQLTLHMAGLGSVGANEGALVVAAHHFVSNLAVEEDDGDTGGTGSLNSVLRSVGRGSLHDVDDQQVGAVGDGGVDLVGLLGLVAGAVEVVVLDAHGIQLAVHEVADAGDVHVGEVIVEHAHVQLGSVGVALVVGIGLLLLAAAGQQSQHHHGGQENSKSLFHLSSS